ncbi:MAG: molybdenum cofactor guanylyltransferase MobA [Pseudomonadota bacterium]|nr:molybdenum cofactor guanylyltransferase MobA [Pseudomonadota bacterium]
MPDAYVIPSSPQPACSAIILAGGRASRMQGQDKGLIPLAGQPMIQHVLQRVAPQVQDIVINANRSIADYTALGYPVVNDQVGEFAGPLAGIAAGLAICQQDWALVVACDCPQLPLDLVAQLFAARARQPLVILHDGQRLQPLFMLIHRQLLPALQQALAQQQAKVGQWCLAQHPAILRVAQPAAFANINTEAERLALEQQLLQTNT